MNMYVKSKFYVLRGTFWEKKFREYFMNSKIFSEFEKKKMAGVLKTDYYVSSIGTFKVRLFFKKINSIFSSDFEQFLLADVFKAAFYMSRETFWGIFLKIVHVHAELVNEQRKTLKY